MITEILNTVNKLLEVPSDDPDDARRRKLLNILLVSLMVIGISAIILTLVLDIAGMEWAAQDRVTAYLGISATLIGTVIVFAINRYGTGWIASSILLLFLIIIAATTDNPAEVADGRGLLTFAIPIMIGSVILPPASSFVMAALSSLAIWIVKLTVPGGGLPNLFAMFIFFMLAIVSWLSASVLERTLKKARNRAHRLAVVNRIAQAAGSVLRMDDLAEIVYREVIATFQADAFFFALYDEEADELDFRILVDEGTRHPQERHAASTGWTSFIIDEKKPLIIRDAEQESLPVGKSFGTMKAPLGWLGAPMMVGERVIGIINVQTYHSHAWEEEEEDLLLTIADQVAVAVENARLYEAIQQELTERERAEKKLRILNKELDQRVQERTRDLAEALSKNEAVLESIADGVIVFDNNGQATLVNSSIIDLLGQPADKIVGLDIQELIGDVVNGDVHSLVVDLLRDKSSHHPSAKLKWGDKTLSVSIAPVELASGRGLGSVAVFRDFTREANIDRMKSTFVAIASHELRTPLGAILGYAEMLQSGVYGPLSEKQLNTLGRIIANIGRLLNLVNNLLDQAQIESGMLELDAAPFALESLIQEVMGVMDVLAQSKGVELTYQIADELPAVLFGDRQRLNQVLVNLVSNGVKFTDEGSVSINASRPGEEHWALRVSDTGRGISSQDQSQIFDPFRRADESLAREYAGAGLGLSIVKQLVEMMEGKITLESEMEQGSTFTIVLPITPSDWNKPQ